MHDKSSISNYISRHASALIAIAVLFLGVALTIATLFFRIPPLEAVALFLVLIVILGFFYNPALAFLVLIALRPAIDYIGANVSFTLEDIGTININSCIGIFIFLWGSCYLAYKRVRIHSISLFYPLLILSCVTVASFATSHSLLLTAGEWIRVSSFAVICLLAYHFVATSITINQLFLAIAASSAIPLFFSWYQFLTSTGISDEASSNRIFGTFAHPALFGYYLAFLIILTAGIYPILREYREWLLFYLSLLSITLALTYTRGAWLFGLVGICAVGYVHYRKILVASISVAAICVASFLAFSVILASVTDTNVLQGQLATRIYDTFHPSSESSMMWRFQFWKDALTPLSASNLITGYGAGTFIEYADNELNTRFDAHNDYLKLLVEIGIGGVIAFILLYAWIIWLGMSAYKRSRNSNVRAYSSLLCVLSLCILLLSMVDNVYQNTTLYWLLFSFVGGSLAFIYAKKTCTIDRAMHRN